MELFAFASEKQNLNFTPRKHQFVANRGWLPLFIPGDFCFFCCFQNQKQILVLSEFRLVCRLQRFRMRELGVHLHLCRSYLDTFINTCGSHRFRHFCIFCQVCFRIRAGASAFDGCITALVSNLRDGSECYFSDAMKKARKKSRTGASRY